MGEISYGTLAELPADGISSSVWLLAAVKRLPRILSHGFISSVYEVKLILKVLEVMIKQRNLFCSARLVGPLAPPVTALRDQVRSRRLQQSSSF